MFSRHLIAAAALMAVTCAANADVITTTSTLASDMSIVDTSTSLGGADTGLAAILATPTTSSQFVLVRGVEGLYMLGRTNAPLTAASETATVPATTTTVPATTSTTTTSTPAAAAGDASDIVAAATSATAAATTAPLALTLAPTISAIAVVPEPATLALMFAGLLGVVGFTRARKQG